jgi:hypothetical protein
MNLGNEMVEEGVTIIKIDKPRGIAILVRKSLIRFEHVPRTQREVKPTLTNFTKRYSISFQSCFQIRMITNVYLKQNYKSA